jgi:hypothetical protein
MLLDTPTTDLLAAVEAWQPDANCIAAGDEYAALMLRCFAAAGLSNTQIARRVLDLAQVSADVDTPIRRSAADAVAQQCAIIGVPLRHTIIAILAYLAAEAGARRTATRTLQLHKPRPRSSEDVRPVTLRLVQR